MATRPSPLADRRAARKRSSNMDPFFNSRSVEGLMINTYDEFLAGKDAALVMFYDPNDPQSEWSKKHFLKAAKTTERANHAFCAVDCTKETELCDMEGITSIPYFKLLSRGKPMANISNARSFIFHDMKKFVENAPVLEDPPRVINPCELAKEGKES